MNHLLYLSLDAPSEPVVFVPNCMYINYLSQEISQMRISETCFLFHANNYYLDEGRLLMELSVDLVTMLCSLCALL